MAGYMTASIFPKWIDLAPMESGRVILRLHQGDGDYGSGMRVYLDPALIAQLVDLLTTHATPTIGGVQHATE